MKTMILPIVWYGTAVSSFAGSMFLTHRIFGWKLLFGIPLAWLLSNVAALLVGGLLVAWRPDLKFSTKKEIEGLGFVHEFMGTVVYMTLFAVSLGVACAFHR